MLFGGGVSVWLVAEPLNLQCVLFIGESKYKSNGRNKNLRDL